MPKLPLAIVHSFLALSPLVVGQQGGIVSWGSDNYGQVSNTPIGTSFVQVAGGETHSLALKVDGSIVSWGNDLYGQVSNTPLTAGFASIAAGDLHSIAVQSDGSLESWGNDGYSVVSGTPAGTGFVQVSGGHFYSIALKSDGSLFGWGYDSYWQVSDIPSGNNLLQVACGYEHVVALLDNGSIVAWGRDNYGQVANIPSGTDFVQVAAGDEHSVGLKSDGSIVSWGRDSSGEVSGTPPGTGFVKVACGRHHSVALNSDGTIASWGGDVSGVVSSTPTGADYWDVAAGEYHSVSLLLNDADADGLSDESEDQNANGVVDPGETDPLDQDTDDDGISDGEEVSSPRPDTRWILGPSGNYYRLAAADTWSQARASAVSQGHDLASAQDQSEADWLYVTFGEISGDFWIGLTDFSGIFEWSDGSPVSYTQWATGEPNTTFVAAYVGGPAASEPGNWYAEFAGVTSRMAVWETPGPNPPQTALDPLSWDTDGDGLGDGQEDGLGAILWDGDLDGDGIPDVGGTDPLAFVPDSDPLSTTDPLDLDSDEDGLSDGAEDADGDGSTGVAETSPVLADTDGDGLTDGLELGLTVGTLDTDGNVFIPDSDPWTTTDPLELDTDLGGVEDGIEDQNLDGAVDTWETDPNLGSDEAFAFYVSNALPGEKLQFEVFNATPNTPILPAASLAGPGPIMLTIGILMDLSSPVNALTPRLAGSAGHAAWEGQRLPNAVQLGRDIWFQAIEVPLSPFLPPRASNPILLPVGSN